MYFNSKIKKLIEIRSSWRTYTKTKITSSQQNEIMKFVNNNKKGVFGNRARFRLISAIEDDYTELKGLGTYGFIKNAPAFLIGAMERVDNHLIDYGYIVERIILKLTDMGLGSCWLGGTFNKSSFSSRIELKESEVVPAVVAFGNRKEKRRTFENIIRGVAKSKTRKEFGGLFFDKNFEKTISIQKQDNYYDVLEMVRLAPSASNKQPWRIIRDIDEQKFHLYLKRTPGYFKGKENETDLQLIDMGIAMLHFDLSANEKELKGRWTVENKSKDKLPEHTEYIATWIIES